MDTAWLIGSTFLEAVNIEVNGNPQAVAGGYRYLRSDNAALSLIAAFEDAIQEEEATAVVTITRGRHVRITADNAVSVDWLSATTLRDLLGFTGNLSSGTSHVAPNVSPLLWSPGWPATPETLLGTAGYVTNDQSRMVSADGTRVLVTSYYEQVHQDLSWTHILAERLRVAAGVAGGGTFHELHEQSLKLGYSVRYYETIDEEDGDDATAVTWDDTADNSFGPYVLRSVDPRWYRRVLENADLYGSITLPLMQVAEYT